MRRIALGTTGISTSQLGFGCSRLTALGSRREAIALLESAYACGITHFDVARIYGFGRSEGILGEFLRGKRDGVTVATKFGILPPSGLSGNPGLIQVAKKILGPFPKLLGRLRQRGASKTKMGVFTAENAVQSLELSLRELGTDFVDVFFLHEATLADAESEPLIEALQLQVKRGTIRSFGLATDFAKLQEDAGRVPAAYRILQFDDNAASRNLSRLSHHENFSIITHSVFQPFARIREASAAHLEWTQKYSRQMALDLTDAKVLGALLVQYALHSNASGITLFSTTDPRRVDLNARDAYACAFSEEQLTDFVEFLDLVLRPLAP
jgi:aryl-alcohol dehydrogenase-like predicted oxidoreductase